MKRILAAAVALAALSVSSSAMAQSAADTLKAAATQTATQAATDQINKAAGTSAAKQGEHKAKKAKDDNEPNYGRSEEHRQDGEHGHKGKHKGQD
jgi:hypothetical protein